VTVKGTALLVWPMADTTSCTFCSGAVQSAPLGWVPGTVNWMEAFDQLVVLIGEPSSSS